MGSLSQTLLIQRAHTRVTERGLVNQQPDRPRFHATLDRRDPAILDISNGGNWVYVGADGSEHTFYTTLHMYPTTVLRMRESDPAY